MKKEQDQRSDKEAGDLLALLRQREPVLKDPDGLTEAIMADIKKGEGRSEVRVLFFIRRMLAAASIAILLLFGYEQFRIVEQISRLEAQFAQVKPAGKYPDPSRLLTGTELSKAGISLEEIERFLVPGKSRDNNTFYFIKKRLDQKKSK